MLCTKLNLIWPCGSTEEVKNVNSLQTGQIIGLTDRWIDDGQWVIRKPHLNLQLK